MKIFIALFHGINVGGRNLLPMKDLVAIMEDCGHSNVRTYIQSGNVVFDGDSVSASEIARQVEQQKGFCPEGIGRSKLASNVECCLGVPDTGRIFV